MSNQADNSTLLDETVFREEGMATAELNALVIKNLLEANGIPALVVGEAVLPNLPFEVKVSHRNAERARQLVAESERRIEPTAEKRSNVQHTHPTPRKYLELTQDVIVFGLCVMLFVGMGIKLFQLGKLMLAGIDFSLVMGDVLFVLVLLELFRLLLIYLEEHRVSVGTMVEVGIVSTLREVILRGALHIDWQQLLVLSAFLLTLTVVLRYSGIRSRVL